MVQAVALLFAGGAGATVTVFGVTLATGGALTLAGSIVNAAIGLGINAALANANRPDPPTVPRPENIKANSKVSTGDRFFHFGRVKVGGNVVFHRSWQGFSFLLFVHGHGEIDGIERTELNAAGVTVTNGQVQDAQYQFNGTSKVTITERMGQVPSPHYAEITQRFPEWTPNHRLDGLSTTLMITGAVPPQDDRRMYPRGDPLLTRVIRGARFYDPRLGSRAWTENAAIVMAGLIEHPDFFNQPDAIDWDDVAREAAFADIWIAASNEFLWRLSGSASLMEAPQDVLRRMMDATGSKAVLKPNGKVGIRLGVWREPVLTLTTDDLLQIEEIPARPGVGEGYNTVSVRYVDPALNFTEVDARQLRDAARIEEDGGELERGLEPMLYSPSERQTLLAAQVKMERDNPKSKFRAIWRPRALAAISEPFINVDMPELGVVGTFEVVASSETYEDGGLRGVMLMLHEFRRGALTLGIYGQDDPQTLPPPPVETGIPTPQNVLCVGAGIQASQQTFTAGISVAWDAPGNDGLAPIVEYRRFDDPNAPAATGTGWVALTLDATATNVQIPGLADGVEYDVRVSFVSAGGQQSDYVTFTQIEAVATASLAAPPTGLSLSQSGGEVTIEFSASTSANNWKSQILRDGTLIADIVTPPGIFIRITDTPDPGTISYTARAINVSGQASAETAAETITV